MALGAGLRGTGVDFRDLPLVASMMPLWSYPIGAPGYPWFASWLTVWFQIGWLYAAAESNRSIACSSQ